MKVVQQLDVSDNEFYTVLINSLVAEIEQATGKKQKPYKNFKYTKELSAYGKTAQTVTTKITDLIENKCYEAQFEYGQGINSVRF